jgi:hypothetical protein
VSWDETGLGSRVVGYSSPTLFCPKFGYFRVAGDSTADRLLGSPADVALVSKEAAAW